MAFNINNKKLELDYPCPWLYKVIGIDEALIRAAVACIAGEMEYTIAYSKTSKGGKYCSLDCTVVVPREEIRLALYEVFKNDPAVTMVL